MLEQLIGYNSYIQLCLNIYINLERLCISSELPQLSVFNFLNKSYIATKAWREKKCWKEKRMKLGRTELPTC